MHISSRKALNGCDPFRLFLRNASEARFRHFCISAIAHARELNRVTSLNSRIGVYTPKCVNKFGDNVLLDSKKPEHCSIVYFNAMCIIPFMRTEFILKFVKRLYKWGIGLGGQHRLPREEIKRRLPQRYMVSARAKPSMRLQIMLFVLHRVRELATTCQLI